MGQNKNCDDILSENCQNQEKFRKDVSEVLFLFQLEVRDGAEANFPLAMELAKKVTTDEVGEKNIASEVVRIWYR